MARPPPPAILVVDDEPDIRTIVQSVLAQDGYEVLSAEGVRDALEIAGARCLDALLLDLRLRDGNGLDLLARLRSAGVQVPTIVVTGFADLGKARAAMRLGAVDLIQKPFESLELRTAVQRCVRAGKPRPEPPAGDLCAVMGSSPAIRALDEEVSRIAATDLSVVIAGETGTGKEVVAQAVHARSPRHGGPFVALDCGAISETLVESELFGHERGAFTGADRRRAGRVERASGGTLLLDEVENLSPAVQMRLLRVLEERKVERLGSETPVEVDFRLVAATNVPLEARVRDGRFRLDLYHRLAEATVALPPLRERPEDIAYLAGRFLAEACREFRKDAALAGAALAVLERYPWPGNVRELRNAVRHSVLCARGAEVKAGDIERRLAVLGGCRVDGAAGIQLAAAARVVAPPGGTLREVVRRVVAAAEKAAIVEMLARCHGNKSEAARRLGCDWKTLATKCRAYGIGASPPGAAPAVTIDEALPDGGPSAPPAGA